MNNTKNAQTVVSNINNLPKIGAQWQDGEIYAGIVSAKDGAADYCLIVHDEDHNGVNHEDAVKWAKHLVKDGLQAWSLPRRAEQAVMFGNVPSLFKRDVYWSCEYTATYIGSAWCQSFKDGHQYFSPTHALLRARAVRRISISD